MSDEQLNRLTKAADALRGAAVTERRLSGLRVAQAVVAIGFVVLGAVWVSDLRTKACWIDGPTTAREQLVCDMALPLVRHHQLDKDPIPTAFDGRVAGAFVWSFTLAVVYGAYTAYRIPLEEELL